MAEEKNGRWVTINGAHVFIEKGQSVNDAVGKLSDGKRGKKRISNGKHEYSTDEGKSWNEMSREAYGEYDADEDDFDMTTDADFEEEKDTFENAVREKFDEWKKYAYAENQDEETVDKGNELAAQLWDMSYDKMTPSQKKRFENEWYGTADPDVLESILEESFKNEKDPSKEIEKREKDFDNLKKMGWSNDRIINAFANEGYDEKALREYFSEDGTNGWKPSEEASPVERGFYDMQKGDKWVWDDGRSVTIKDVEGNNVQFARADGRTQWLSKDDFSYMIDKNATKYQAEANKEEAEKPTEPKKGKKSSPAETKKANGDEKEIYEWVKGDGSNERHLRIKSGPYAGDYDNWEDFWSTVKLGIKDKTTENKTENNKNPDNSEQTIAKQKKRSSINSPRSQKLINSTAKEIYEYYDGDHIDYDEVYDILEGEYGFGIRMTNAIVKRVKELEED